MRRPVVIIGTVPMSSTWDVAKEHVSNMEVPTKTYVTTPQTDHSKQYVIRTCNVVTLAVVKREISVSHLYSIASLSYHSGLSSQL